MSLVNLTYEKLLCIGTAAECDALTSLDGVEPGDCCFVMSPFSLRKCTAASDTSSTWVVQGVADATAFHNNASGEISALPEKVSPVSDDVLVLENSANSFGKNKVKVGNLGGGAAQFEYDVGWDTNQQNVLTYLGIGTSNVITTFLSGSSSQQIGVITRSCKAIKLVLMTSDFPLGISSARLHKGAGASPTAIGEAVIVDVKATFTGYVFDFSGQNLTFSTGDLFAISVDSTSATEWCSGRMVFEEI